MGRTILTDIDGTLSNSRWRDGLIGAVSWDEYHEKSQYDEPYQNMIGLIRSLHEREYYIVGVSSRPEKFRKMTIEWLLKHQVPLDDLLLRPNNNHRPSPELKPYMVSMRMAFNDIAFVFDDREDVIAAFRERGVDGLQVMPS